MSDLITNRERSEFFLIFAARCVLLLGFEQRLQDAGADDFTTPKDRLRAAARRVVELEAVAE